MSGRRWGNLELTFSKCVLKFTGTEATHACKDDHIFVVFNAVINGEVRNVQYVWYSNSNK